jgi:hypothetical protein
VWASVYCHKYVYPYCTLRNATRGIRAHKCSRAKRESRSNGVFLARRNLSMVCVPVEIYCRESCSPPFRMKHIEFDTCCTPSSVLAHTALLVALGLESQVAALCSTVGSPLSLAWNWKRFPAFRMVCLTSYLLRDDWDLPLPCCLRKATWKRRATLLTVDEYNTLNCSVGDCAMRSRTPRR